ncbi:MAG: hypothetical protein ACJ735_11285 [Actinomycetes bacterium]
MTVDSLLVAADPAPWGNDFDTDYPDLDAGIRRAVRVFMEAGVETFESCQGGEGHAYPEPTIRFYGTQAAGWRALHIALEHGLPISAVRRTWPVLEGGPVGPYWEAVFSERVD